MIALQRLTAALVVAIACASTLVANEKTPTAPILLQPNQSHTFPSSSQQSQYFEYDSDGAPFALTVRQGLDLTVHYTPQTGAPRAVNSPLGRFSLEVIAARDPAPGLHRFKVISNELTNAIHPSTIQIRPLTSTTFDAYEQIEAATRITANLTPELRIEHLAQAVTLAESSADGTAHAHALLAMAQIQYWDMTDWTRAADLADLAATEFEALDDIHSATGARQLRGLARLEKALEQSQTSDADQAYRAVLAELQAVKRDFDKQDAPRDAAVTLGYIGTGHFYQSHWLESAAHWRAAAKQLHELGEFGDERQSVSNLAILDMERGRFFAGIDGVKRVLDLTGSEDFRGRAAMLELLGSAYRQIGNIDDSLQSSLQALTIHRDHGHKPGIANAQTNIGSTYLLTGEFERAKDYLVEALSSLSELNDPRLEALASRGLARAYQELGKPEQALASNQRSLELAKVPAEQARARLAMAQSLRSLGLYERAREQLKYTLQFAEETGAAQLSARTALELGELATVRQLPTAAKLMTAAIEQFAELSDYQGLVDANLGLARHYVTSSNLEQAINAANDALVNVEALRDYVSDPQLKAVYLSSSREVHDLLTQTLVRLADENPNQRDEYIRKAWDVDEAARARTLLDMLEEQFDPGSAITTGDTTIRKREITQTLIENLARKRDLLSADNPETMDELKEIEQRIREIHTTLEVLDARNRKISATYKPQVALDSIELQARLPDKTAMLRYALGEQESLLWIMTRHDLIVERLPSRDKIADATRDLLTGLRQAKRGSVGKAKLNEQLNTVASLVWPQQLSEALTGVDQLLVLPADVLHYLPFISLPFGSDSSPVGNRFAVSYLPSASAAAALWRIHQSKGVPPLTIAVFADPVTEASDPRLSAVRSNLDGQNANDVPRLAGTAREARLLASLTRPEERMIAQSFQASRSEVLTANLTDYRYLHFAAHGRIDTRYPQLSSLILSQYQEDGSRITGELRQADIYNLSLNADLVVMSACDTALGREIRGEGLVGLTHAFIAAGAKRVLASLWQLPDQATANFMEVFYEKLFKGEDPASALRDTQMQMAARGLFKHPYYWAGFVLHTELALAGEPLAGGPLTGGTLTEDPL